MFAIWCYVDLRCGMTIFKNRPFGASTVTIFLFRVLGSTYFKRITRRSDCAEAVRDSDKMATAAAYIVSRRACCHDSCCSGASCSGPSLRWLSHAISFSVDTTSFGGLYPVTGQRMTSLDEVRFCSTYDMLKRVVTE